MRKTAVYTPLNVDVTRKTEKNHKKYLNVNVLLVLANITFCDFCIFTCRQVVQVIKLQT